jgi:hypothetical protein
LIEQHRGIAQIRMAMDEGIKEECKQQGIVSFQKNK